jgi:hypothetical protein
MARSFWPLLPAQCSRVLLCIGCFCGGQVVRPDHPISMRQRFVFVIMFVVVPYRFHMKSATSRLFVLVVLRRGCHDISLQHRRAWFVACLMWLCDPGSGYWVTAPSRLCNGFAWLLAGDLAGHIHFFSQGRSIWHAPAFGLAGSWCFFLVPFARLLCLCDSGQEFSVQCTL